MTIHRMSALVAGLGLCLLPSLGVAQPSATVPAQPAAPGNSSPGPSSDTSWSSAVEPAPAATGAPLDANPTPQPPVPPTQPAASANGPSPAASSSSLAVSTPEPPAPANATKPDEPPTLFGKHGMKVGGYGAIGVRYARINGQDAALGGVEGALLLDHRFAIGFAGYGWSNEQKLTASQFVDRPYMHVGYGGLLLRYHFYIPQTPVAISVATLVGGGAIGLTAQWDDRMRRDNTDVFFIFEPQVGAHLNLTRWLRIGLDAGYRLTSGVSRFGFTESDINGVSLGGDIGFGWF